MHPSNLSLTTFLPLLLFPSQTNKPKHRNKRTTIFSYITTHINYSFFIHSIITTLVSNNIMDSSELRRVFQMFDRNGDGCISKKELNHSLCKLGIDIPETDLAAMIDKIDVNGDGCVDLDEFTTLYKSIMDDHEEDEEEDMREAFNVFDQNGDGFITEEELRSVLASLGLKQGRTVEDCRRMIRKVDVDGDGMVNFKEFKQMMRGGGFSALTN